MKIYLLLIHHFHVCISRNFCILRKVWKHQRQISLHFGFLFLTTFVVFCQVWINLIGIKTIQEKPFTYVIFACHSRPWYYSVDVGVVNFSVKVPQSAAPWFSHLDMQVQRVSRKAKGSERKAKGNFQKCPCRVWQWGLRRICSPVREGGGRRRAWCEIEPGEPGN